MNKIELVTEAIRRWCEEHNQSIEGERDRAALQAAIAIALNAKWDPADFLQNCEGNWMARLRFRR
jgi:hypothetical protein